MRIVEHRLIWEQYLEIDASPFGLGHVHYVGDNVPGPTASAHLAGEKQPARSGGFAPLDDEGRMLEKDVF